MIEIRSAPLDLPLAALAVAINSDSKPHQSALAEGRFLLQRCTHCMKFRYPVAPVCANCDTAAFGWEDAPERGSVYSFVSYTRAPLPVFQPISPYSVVCVDLGGGLRLMGRWLDPVTPAIGHRAVAVAERWSDGGLSIAFRPDT